MIRRAICSPSIHLLMLISSMFCVGFLSGLAQAQSTAGQNPHLIFSSYLGGCGAEGEGGTYSDDNSNGNNIAVDARGLIYVTGTTGSTDCSDAIRFLITPNAMQPNLKGAAGSTDAFLCIIDPGKSGLDSMVYSRFIGGTQNEKGPSMCYSTIRSNRPKNFPIPRMH